MKKYKLICKKGEGTFSEVVCGQNIENGKQFAIKCMKSSFDSLHQVNNLREIQALKRLTPHPHIVNLEEVLFDEPSGRLAMVFELMDINLYDLISGRRERLDAELVRSLGYQMFVALDHMHGHGIFHRDIKPENILVDSTGKHLKLADLGSCRSINSKPPMTEYIATRWYRSPECLLTDGHYGPEMDIWGAGCVLFEIIALFPLFPGADEVDQVNRIHKVVGTPPDDIISKLRSKGSTKINYKFGNMKGIGIKHFIPHATTDCVNLLNKTMIYDHTERIAASDAIEHPYFFDFRQKDKTLRSKPNKLSLRKNARVEEDKAPSTNTKKQSKNKIEKASETDNSGRESKRMVRARPQKQTEGKIDNLKSIKSTLQKRNGSKPSKASKLASEKPSNIKNLSNQNRIRRVANNPRLPGKKNETSQPQPQQEQSKNTKSTGLKATKYSGVKSSGYGRTYKPQPTSLRARLRGGKEQGSGGTDKTSAMVVSDNEFPVQRQNKNRLQKNKLSLADKKKRRERSEYNLPQIRA